MKSYLTWLFFLLSACNVFSAPLASDGMVFLVKIGQDGSGNPLYQVADSSDQRATYLFNRFYKDQGIQKVVSSHRKVETEINSRNVPAGYHSSSNANPVFIELGTQTGTYNDWEGNFSVRDSYGRVQSYSQPRVVLDLNDSIFQSSDPSIVEQTVVHEISHGIMKTIYGGNIPQTEWLGRAHYGDLVTDEKLALIEGWAEFAGAYFTGRNTIAEDPAEAIMQNAYAYQDNGQPKTPENLMKTEGWVATMFLHVATHPSITNGYEKLLQVMMEGKDQGFNELLKNFLAKYPEDSKAISEILLKNSIRQFQAPLGNNTQTVAQTPANPLPAVDVPAVGAIPPDRDLQNLFNDYLSSLNTLAQLKLDSLHSDWYAGSSPQEIQRRLSFQTSLVSNLESRLKESLRFDTNVNSQDLIAQTVLDNLEKIRFEHNQALQSYNNTSWWNQAVKTRLSAELNIYKELYERNKLIADSMNQETLRNVWSQRMARLQYRTQQASDAVAASATTSRCNGSIDADCKDAYDKLMFAIESNQGRKETERRLLNFQNTQNQ